MLQEVDVVNPRYQGFLVLLSGDIAEIKQQIRNYGDRQVGQVLRDEQRESLYMITDGAHGVTVRKQGKRREQTVIRATY
jgi:hypothetical protein